jgi:serine/threonine-protein kinase
MLPQPDVGPTRSATGSSGGRGAHPARVPFAAGVALVAVLGLLVGAAGWWLGDGRWTAVPPVVGVERGAAERLLLDADLAAAVTVARHDTVPAGVVSAVDPAPPARLRRGGRVTLTVSSGRPVVPAVNAGTAVDAAERAVRDAGLTPVRGRQEYSATAPAGTVVRTDPPAGTALPSDGRVALVTSKGVEPPRQVRVPFLLGRTVSDARAALAAAGLRADVEDVLPIGARPPDQAQVVAQDHGAGSLVDRGTVVVLRAL